MKQILMAYFAGTSRLQSRHETQTYFPALDLKPEYLEAIEKYNMMLTLGSVPAGTGKTYLAA